MDPKIEVLSLFLKELGEQSTIEGIDERMRLQKAVYVGQLFEVDLGYRFSWYVRGPYSTGLTQDYYKLAEMGAAAKSEKTLKPAILERLARAKRFLEKPEDVNLSIPHWYELLASLHYLYKVSGLGSEKVRETIAKSKSHLVQWVGCGEARLKQFALLSE